MARTSASFRNSVERGGPRGFTLLEILVVLALLALVTGLVAPLFFDAAAAARARGARADLQAVLESLPVRAFRQNRPLQIEAQELGRLVDLPPGWSVQMDRPLRYSSAGVAEGGRLQLVAAGETVASWRVERLSGAVVEGAAGTWR